MVDEQTDINNFRKALERPAAGPKIPHRACLCEKLLNEKEYARQCHSGIVNFTECLCDDCRKETKGFVRIVCLGCKTLMSLLPPQKVATGFEFKADTCAHVEKCQSCSPGLSAVPVLEHLRYCRERGIPTNVDQDIVQETEQKALQAQDEAAKLGAELNSSPPHEAANPQNA